jgi:hypothetical protein
MSLFDHAAAEISACGLYRYRLTRTWNGALRPAAFIMLNPSVADAERDDPTIRRCVRFAEAWGCGGIVVVNLFAYRATDPKQLFKVFYNPATVPGNGDPIGPENDRHIRQAVEQCHPVVAAWGNHGVMMLRDEQVRRLLSDAGVSACCLGLTKGGHPRHPLYVRGDVVPMPFPPKKEVSLE